MKFVNISSRPDGRIDSILCDLPQANNEGKILPEDSEKFLTSFMALATDNIQVELEDHEELFIVIDAKFALSITNAFPEQTTFNLGSYLKILSPTQSSFTYYVVMDKKRTDSVCIKELMSEDRCSVTRQGKSIGDVFTCAEFKVGAK